MRLIEQWRDEVDLLALKIDRFALSLLKNVVIFYAKLMIEKSMLCRFSNNRFALKKYRILDIENSTSNKKKFNMYEYSAD